MSHIVIKAENVGKLYRLGEIGTGTLSHDLNRWWARKRGKEDPFSKIGELNDRTVTQSDNSVWALKDINFEVRQGEVLGIIGRNGAGKSTLLKILSKVTSPTVGQIKIRGRIASLLEVGTGFHPELTGRENIFLNGAILGMTNAEIRKKFDDIVEFSGVQKYIDTPVKRYSSGMHVRLAFAVAAFLEPEILIIDEVLAVGDAEFQKKCIGRMREVSKEDGRTVLFVSHDLLAVEKLCNNSLLLANGRMDLLSTTDVVLQRYNEQLKGKKTDKIILTEGVRLLNFDISNKIDSGDDLPFNITIEYQEHTPTILDFCLLLYNSRGVRIAIFDLREKFSDFHFKDNKIEIRGILHQVNLIEGDYSVGIFYQINQKAADILDVVSFKVTENTEGFERKYHRQYRGIINFSYTIL